MRRTQTLLSHVVSARRLYCSPPARQVSCQVRAPHVFFPAAIYCHQQAQRLRNRPEYHVSREIRAFSTSRTLWKKGGKAARDEKAAELKSSPNGAPKSSEDPFDFSSLEQDIAAALERLKSDLSKLRSGGRFNPELLETLRVIPSKSNPSQTVRLSDIAQVIPKGGRVLHILVGEQDHVKPTQTAIQSSSLSLTPQPDPTGGNPLLLVVNIPPPTAESRKKAVDEAVKAGEKAGASIRDGRAKQQKKLRSLQLDKKARPDDLKKAGTMMEKIVEKGVAEVKKIVDGAKKVLDAN